MAKAKESWLVFVDTNIWLDFYRLGGESADRQLAALEKHQQLLIITDQVHMEFLKNRQTVIATTINQLNAPSNVSVPPIVTDSKAAKSLAAHIKGAAQKYKKVTDRVENILRSPTQTDPVYKSLTRIFRSDSKLNLKRPDKQRYEVRRLARKRFLLGYPPRKKSDISIGDAINWEWIIKCAIASDENHNILIVSRDGDFGLTYRDTAILNDWLHREFKERVSRKRKIELTNKLTLALRRLDEVVRPEDEKEEKEVIESWRLNILDTRSVSPRDSDELRRFWSRLVSDTGPISSEDTEHA